MTAMKGHLCINVIVDVRGMNVNTHVGASKRREFLHCAPKALCHVSLGQRPRNPWRERAYGIFDVDSRRSTLSAPPPRPANGERIEVRGIRKRLFRRRVNN